MIIVQNSKLLVSLVCTKRILLGGPVPTLVYADTVHSYMVYGASNGTDEFVNSVSICLDSAPAKLVRITVYPRITPFLSSGTTGSQASDTLSTSVAVTLKSSGAPDGTKREAKVYSLKSKIIMNVYHPQELLWTVVHYKALCQQ